jgi:hypothetical protein
MGFEGFVWGFSSLGVFLFEGVLYILGFIVSWGILLYLVCLMGVSFESWVLLYYGGLFCILGVRWGILLGFFNGGYFVSWVFV